MFNVWSIYTMTKYREKEIKHTIFILVRFLIIYIQFYLANHS